MDIVIWRVSCADTNYGEIAIMHAIIDDLLRMPDLDITLLSEIPEATETHHIHGKIKVVNSTYRQIVSVIKEISEADIFIWAGGHLFHDEVSSLQVIDNLIKLSIPIFTRKPVFIWGAGLGPLESRFLKICTRHVLQKVSVISVRNPESLSFCHALSPSSSIHLTADPSFSLIKKDLPSVYNILSNYKIDTNKPLLGIIPRVLFNRRFSFIPLSKRIKFGLLGKCFREENYNLRQILAHVADYAIEELGCEVLFFPEDTNPNARDHMFAREIIRTMICGSKAKLLAGNHKIEEVLAIFKQMALVLSMRLHGLIFASAQCIPVIAIASSKKFERYMEVIGQSRYCIDQKKIDKGEIENLVNTLLSERKPIANTLKTKIESLERLASRNYSVFLRLKQDIES